MASLMASAKGGGKDFEIHPQEVVAARCTRIIDLGSHDGEYKGKPKVEHKVMFAFESELLTTDGDFEGQPFLVMQQWSLSLSEKALMRKGLEGWRGRKFTAQELENFDLKNVLGKPAMLNIVHSEPNNEGKVYANIATLSPLPGSMKANPAVGELLFFSITGLESQEDFDQVTFDKLSDRLKEKISASNEYKALFGSGRRAVAKPAVKQQQDDDDDIPF